MKYFIMDRRGIIIPSRSTSNQCKIEGWKSYNYDVRMVFNGNLELDKDGFIIDNITVDQTISGLKLRGSCEQMHKEIFDALSNLFEKKGIRMLACRCSIYPSSNPEAVLHHIHCSNATHLKTLSI